ncbi:MAG: efflux RND transporter permease subunit, partial [Bacillota bacterium]
ADSLPSESGTPMILRLNPDMLPIMNFSVSLEDTNPDELSTWVDDELTPRIERIPGVASLNVSGAAENEIRVTINQEKLDEKNAEIQTAFDTMGISDEAVELDKDMISQVIGAQNMSFPAGYVEAGGNDYLVRVGDDLEDLTAVEELLVFEGPDGVPVEFPTITVDDIADVEFVEAEDKLYSKVNGENAVSISIQKGSGYATTEVTNDINQELMAIASENDDFDHTVLLDQGEYIEQANGSVLNNLLIGGILAVLILLVFLRNVRVTLIVGVAIPVSLLFAVILIYLSDITLNVVSLGGLALGIGMLVDNSIVVIENIFRMKRDGATNKKAAVSGANQVAGAIVASTLTTVSVFLPIMFIEGFVREIFYQLALTISFSLLASLIIALTFVPTLANRIMKDDEGKKDDSKSWMTKIQNVYERILNGAFKLKYIVIAVVFLLLGLTVVGSTSEGFEFFPASDEGSLQATIEVKDNETMNYEDFTDKLDELYGDVAEFRDVSDVGITVGGGGQAAMLGFSQGNRDTTSATMNVVLRDDREQTTMEMRDDIIALLESDYEAFETDIQGTEMDTGALVGEGLSLRLKGSDLEVLRSEAESLASIVREVEGVRDVETGLENIDEEIKVTVDKDVAITYGLTVGQVLQKVSEHLETPEEITSLSMDGHMYSLYVYGEGDERRVSEENVADLEGIVVGETTMGDDVTLGEIATVETVPGFGSITRIDGTRVIDISAEFESGYSSTIVASDVEDALEGYDLPSGYEYEVMGESEEIMATLDELVIMGALGILLVYMIMASQFQSLLYPFIIMLTIPLAFTGGFGILYAFNMPVSIVAVIGLIILSGVVVNNGIVLVDYINQLRERGYELKAAITRAGRIRLRPIFMTALTTMLALSPLALGYGEGAEMMQPMALTAIGGLFYATFLTIFVVPIFYHMMTLHGRLIFGILVTLAGAAASVYYFFFTYNLLYALLALGVMIGALILTIFLPSTSVKPTSEEERADDVDQFLKRTMK